MSTKMPIASLKKFAAGAALIAATAGLGGCYYGPAYGPRYAYAPAFGPGYYAPAYGYAPYGGGVSIGIGGGGRRW